MEVENKKASTEMKYVAFCDILGFSNAVLNRFDETIKVYVAFKEVIRGWPFAGEISVSLYSDSVIIVGKDLPYILKAVKELHWAALMHGWLIRGGVAYGKHWQETEKGNLFIVSEALTKAVSIEKSVGKPIVAISNDISLGIEAWIPRFQKSIFEAALLFYTDIAFVNPFNPYWFKSAKIHAQNLLEKNPNHKDKYEWFLSLVEQVEQDKVLVPDSSLSTMIELGVLKKTQ